MISPQRTGCSLKSDKLPGTAHCANIREHDFHFVRRVAARTVSVRTVGLWQEPPNTRQSFSGNSAQ